MLHFCLHLLKVEEAVENFKTVSGSSPFFALSNDTTCSQTQTGVTVPLRQLVIPLLSPLVAFTHIPWWVVYKLKP